LFIHYISAGSFQGWSICPLRKKQSAFFEELLTLTRFTNYVKKPTFSKQEYTPVSEEFFIVASDLQEM